jgi:hypothetical protein
MACFSRKILFTSLSEDSLGIDFDLHFSSLFWREKNFLTTGGMDNKLKYTAPRNIPEITAEKIIPRGKRLNFLKMRRIKDVIKNTKENKI